MTRPLPSLARDRDPHRVAGSPSGDALPGPGGPKWTGARQSLRHLSVPTHKGQAPTHTFHVKPPIREREPRSTSVRMKPAPATSVGGAADTGFARCDGRLLPAQVATPCGHADTHRSRPPVPIVERGGACGTSTGSASTPYFDRLSNHRHRRNRQHHPSPRHTTPRAPSEANTVEDHRSAAPVTGARLRSLGLSCRSFGAGHLDGAAPHGSHLTASDPRGPGPPRRRCRFGQADRRPGPRPLSPASSNVSRGTSDGPPAHASPSECCSNPTLVRPTPCGRDSWRSQRFSSARGRRCDAPSRPRWRRTRRVRFVGGLGSGVLGGAGC